MEYTGPPSAFKGCPYFGLVDDAQTRILFASPGADCHRVEPSEHIDLRHQQVYCLTAEHQQCPVFNWPSERRGRLPREISGRTGIDWSRAAYLIGAPALVLLLVLLISYAVTRVSSLREARTEALASAPLVGSPTPTRDSVLAEVTPAPAATTSPTTAALPIYATATATPSRETTATVTATPPATASPRPTASPTLAPAAEETPRVRIALPSSSLRLGPDISFPRLRYLQHGEEMRVLGRYDGLQDWYLVLWNGELEGWVAVNVTEAINPDLVAAVPWLQYRLPTPSATPSPAPTLAVSVTGTVTTAPGDLPGSGTGLGTRGPGDDDASQPAATPGAATRTPPPIPAG